MKVLGEKATQSIGADRKLSPIALIGSVRPGLHKPLRDEPNVTWWDPSALTLEVEEHATLRHQRILEVDAGKTCR